MPLFFLCLALSGMVRAANFYPDPVFLDKNAVTIATVLPPPPPAGSAIEREDIAKILNYQKTRSAEDCRRASAVEKVTLGTLFGPTDGPLTKAEVDRWESFFKDVRKDVEYFVQESKKYWKRPRPYVAHPEVHACVHVETTPAYPSGHAAISAAFAEILSRLDPKRKAVFSARADRIAEDRVLGGVHHPTDIEAGKKLGQAVFSKLEENAKFKKAFAEAATANQ